MTGFYRLVAGVLKRVNGGVPALGMFISREACFGVYYSCNLQERTSKVAREYLRQHAFCRKRLGWYQVCCPYMFGASQHIRDNMPDGWNISDPWFNEQGPRPMPEEQEPTYQYFLERDRRHAEAASMAFHPRLGAGSCLHMLDPYLMREIFKHGLH